MKPNESQSAEGGVQAQLDAQNLEIAELKAEAINSEQSKELVAGDLRSQVIAQMAFIENLTDIAAANKETTDASTEHLQQQVDSIQQEVDVLTETVASQAADISEIRAESKQVDSRTAFSEHRRSR